MLTENILANSCIFSLEEVILEPSSAERGEKEQPLKLLFMCVVSLRNA